MSEEKKNDGGLAERSFAKNWLNNSECCGQVDGDGVCAAPACIFGDACKAIDELMDALEPLAKSAAKVDDWNEKSKRFGMAPMGDGATGGLGIRFGDAKFAREIWNKWNKRADQ